jgi:hypothetical protein
MEKISKLSVLRSGIINTINHHTKISDWIVDFKNYVFPIL